MLGRVVKVNNKLQQDYTYKLTRSEGDLSDLISFRPDLSPIQMIEYGIGGGILFSDTIYDIEYPKEIRNIIFDNSQPGNNAPYDKTLNYFGVRIPVSNNSLDKSEIIGDDPRGWIEWYLRTWMGRRTEYDKIQVQRWKDMRDDAIRLKNSCQVNDPSCKPILRQTLLEWSYDTINKW